MSTLATTARNAIAGFVGFQALKGIAASFIDVNAKFEGFSAALTTMLGSSQKAEQAMSWIKDFTKTTPFELAEVTASFQRLTALGFDATKELGLLGDTASAFAAPLQQAVEAFADAATFEFERLKEFGITTQQVGDEVTFTWTQNGQQLSQTVSKTREDVTGALREIMAQYRGASAEFGSTWIGMWSNLKDTVATFLESIGKAGLFDALKEQLKSLLEWIQELKDNGTLQQWAQNISDAITRIVNILPAAIGSLKEVAIILGAAAIVNAPAMFLRLATAIIGASTAIRTLNASAL
ncbi:hypothetical protein MCHI_002210 [Candidatus Magnetoovum chiemensis]|nr:hypothetical protein MCHI_002210 [Candidatus Magnetoovum chiemensis]